MSERTLVYCGFRLHYNGMEQLGQRIKALLKNKNMHLRDVRVSPGQLSEVIRGKRRPSSDWLANVARQLDISVDDLIRGTDYELEGQTGALLYCPNRECPGAVWQEVTATSVSTADALGAGKTREFVRFGRTSRLDIHGNVRKFCGLCGTQLLDRNPTPICPRCARLTESESQAFCSGCGLDLKHSRVVEKEFRTCLPDAADDNELSWITFCRGEILTDILDEAEQRVSFKRGGRTLSARLVNSAPESRDERRHISDKSRLEQYTTELLPAARPL